MDARYRAWICKAYPTSESARNQCFTAAHTMVRTFLELRVARGWYGHTEHWWCVAPDGSVVDPTRHQFARDAEYREFQDGIDPEPLGKCMNCGDYCWPFLDADGEPVGEKVPDARENPGVSSCSCSPECEAALRREYNC